MSVTQLIEYFNENQELLMQNYDSRASSLTPHGFTKVAKNLGVKGVRARKSSKENRRIV